MESAWKIEWNGGGLVNFWEFLWWLRRGSHRGLVGEDNRSGAPASVLMLGFAECTPCGVLRGRMIGGGLSDQATRVFEC